MKGHPNFCSRQDLGEVSATVNATSDPQMGLKGGPVEVRVLPQWHPMSLRGGRHPLNDGITH